MKNEEIAELQKGLSEANAELFEQKERVLKLQEENDALTIQEMEDRRRIQHLLALTQPVTEEVTFFRDCRPGKMTRFPVSNQSDAILSPGGSNTLNIECETPQRYTYASPMSHPSSARKKIADSGRRSAKKMQRVTTTSSSTPQKQVRFHALLLS